MAEIVGLVAACLEITETVVEVKQKFRALRNAPAEINDLFQETSRLSKLLEFIIKQQQTLFPNGQPIAEQVDILMQCTSAANQLLECTRTLKKETDRKRWQGAFKVVLKASKIKAYQENLERAKLSLLLAQSTQSMLLHHQQLTQHADTQTLLKLLASQQTTTDSESSTNSQTSDLFLNQASNIIKPVSKHLLSRKRQIRRQYYEFSLPTSWLGWTLHVRAARYFHDWTLNIQQWNIRPNDSPIFQCTTRGDVDAMRRLLSSGEATVRDSTSNGYTLLHFACYGRNINTIKLLIEYGADVNSTGLTTISPLMTFLFSPCEKARTDSTVPTLLEAEIRPMIVLFAEASHETFLDYAETLIFAQLATCYGSIGHKAVSELLACISSCQWPPYKEQPLSVRLCFASYSIIGIKPPPFIATFYYSLGQEFDEECFQRITKDVGTLCHHHENISDHKSIWVVIACGIAASIPERFISDHIFWRDQRQACFIERGGWFDLLCKVVHFGGAENFGNHTTLFFFVNCLTSLIFIGGKVDDIILHEYINMWLDELRKAGLTDVDFQRYAEHEKNMLVGYTWEFPYVDGDESGSVFWKVKDIVADGVPHKWNLSYEWYFRKDLTAEELAAKIPGSFN